MLEYFVEECRSAMLHENMDISMLMVHGQQFEETWLNRKNREYKRAKAYEWVLQRLDLRFKTSLGSKRGSPKNSFQIYKDQQE